MSRDVDIKQWLSGAGYGHPEATQAALEVLYASGLTREGKHRMSETKLEAAQQQLTAALVVTCTAAACQEEARGEPERLRVPAEDKRHCEFCEGSDNHHAVEAFVKRALERRVTRVLVIGGSPSTREQLSALVHGRLDLRSLDGTVRRTGAQAREDMGWAQLVLIWGATELAHKVSLLYTRAPEHAGVRVITVARRGIGALAQAATRSLG